MDEVLYNDPVPQFPVVTCDKKWDNSPVLPATLNRDPNRWRIDQVGNYVIRKYDKNLINPGYIKRVMHSLTPRVGNRNYIASCKPTFHHDVTNGKLTDQTIDNCLLLALDASSSKKDGDIVDIGISFRDRTLDKAQLDLIEFRNYGDIRSSTGVVIVNKTNQAKHAFGVVDFPGMLSSEKQTVVGLYLRHGVH